MDDIASQDVPSSETCCHFCALDGKYMLEVSLNQQWWHFKCVKTKKEAIKWIRWRSACGAICRIFPNTDVT